MEEKMEIEMEIEEGKEKVDKIVNTEQLCRPIEDVMGELRDGSRSVTPEINDLLSGCATKLEELTSSIDGENGSDDIHDRVMKFKITNPSVHIENFNGQIHVLKSLWKKGNGFSLNLRFDFDSFSDLQNFIDYSAELSEKVHALNEPFLREEYTANLDIAFSNAVIVKKEQT